MSRREQYLPDSPDEYKAKSQHEGCWPSFKHVMIIGISISVVVVLVASLAINIHTNQQKISLEELITVQRETTKRLDYLESKMKVSHGDARQMNTKDTPKIQIYEREDKDTQSSFPSWITIIVLCFNIIELVDSISRDGPDTPIYV